jgi:prophage antirepressor-like protein
MSFTKPTVHKFRNYDVRTFHINGQDWIVSYDIVDALEYRETSRWSIGRKMRAKVDPAEKGVYPLQTKFGARAPCIVTVAGARQMIDGSRQPLTPAFCAWLNETFPSDAAASLDKVAA